MQKGLVFLFLRGIFMHFALLLFQMHGTLSGESTRSVVTCPHEIRRRCFSCNVSTRNPLPLLLL